jgi:hypothetical protein
VDWSHLIGAALPSGNINLLCGLIPVAEEYVLRYSEKLADSRRKKQVTQ